jgi:hypothetical protein
MASSTAGAQSLQHEIDEIGPWKRGRSCTSSATSGSTRSHGRLGDPDTGFDFSPKAVVYTSNGVLGWLPDVARWGEVDVRFVRPGGRFYVLDIHPWRTFSRTRASSLVNCA